MSLGEILLQIKHIAVTLDDTYPRDDRHHSRPNLTISCDSTSMYDEPRIIVALQPLWGQPGRDIAFSPDEAESVGRELQRLAEVVRIVISEYSNSETEQS